MGLFEILELAKAFVNEVLVMSRFEGQSAMLNSDGPRLAGCFVLFSADRRSCLPWTLLAN